jgi:hypothetical protein
MRMARADDAFLASIGGQVLSPSICEAVIDGVYEALQPAGIAPERERRERELAAVGAECPRLVQAIAAGGDMAVLLEALKDRQTRQDGLRAAIARLDDRSPRPDRRHVERLVRARLERWKELLGQQVEVGRQLLREILNDDGVPNARQLEPDRLLDPRNRSAPGSVTLGLQWAKDRHGRRHPDPEDSKPSARTGRRSRGLRRLPDGSRSKPTYYAGCHPSL